MAKKKGLSRRLPPKSVAQEAEASNVPSLHVNATLDPRASLEFPTSATWLSDDSTNAPQIEEETSRQVYAQTAPALIDKYVLSRDFIPFTLAVLGIGWIFISDNNAGKLATWRDLLWTLEKSASLLLLFCLILLLHWAYKRWFS
jgi:hypothetical protein